MKQYSLSGDGRVVRDLLDDEVGLAAAAGVWPDTVEDLAEDGVERLRVSPGPAILDPAGFDSLDALRPGLLGTQCEAIRHRKPHPPLHVLMSSTRHPSHSTNELTFFSDPIFSFLVVYCPFNVAMNHFNTRSMRSCAVAPSEMVANSCGCSHQYAGNSVSEIGERMTVPSALWDDGQGQS